MEIDAVIVQAATRCFCSSFTSLLLSDMIYP
ncbi:hypothetical protein RLEG3_24440 [Rhizobium leguminosarum bv. trifolii WSM1689]|nr:hypothetical protein RLEG3_24440 [Rhizobium leguminosarum bv. trifolii WSM1689]